MSTVAVPPMASDLTSKVVATENFHEKCGVGDSHASPYAQDLDQAYWLHHQLRFAAFG
jgi:hypothetical protein